MKSALAAALRSSLMKRGPHRWSWRRADPSVA